MKTTLMIASMVLLSGTTLSQPLNVYEVCAVEYANRGSLRTPVTDIALDTKSTDSISWSFCFWYLQGDNGRRVLVDVGFLADSAALHKYGMVEYERPDLALKRIHVDPNEITDIVITHPHWDHINGLSLFSKGTVWMQKNDFAYFVGDAWQKGANNLGLDKGDVSQIIQANLEGRLQLVNGDSLEIIPGIRVFIGSKHTYECQYLLANTKAENVLIASDASWFYFNLDHLTSVTLVFDPKAYIAQLRRMKTLVSDTELIIPGHDALVLSRFKPVSKGIVRIR